jgi:hypothetical protein
MGILVALIVGLVVWIVGWALGFEALNAFYVTLALLFIAFAARTVAPTVRRQLGRS